MNAAIEHIRFVRSLRDRGEGAQPVAAYVSGLAVECALRALVPEFEPLDRRHDLIEIAKSGAYRSADVHSTKKLSPVLNEMAILWTNTLRFYSSERFLAHCRKRVRSTGLRLNVGEAAHQSVCRRMYEKSNEAVKECQRIWLLKSRQA